MTYGYSYHISIYQNSRIEVFSKIIGLSFAYCFYYFKTHTKYFQENVCVLIKLANSRQITADKQTVGMAAQPT